MTLHVEPGGYLLDAGEGEALWFSGGLLTYKTTGDQTTGSLAVAEVHAPRDSGSPGHRHHHEDEAWYIIDGELSFWLGHRHSRLPPVPSYSVPAWLSTASASPRPRPASRYS
jgi:mannose-6-phosphate isomerase-like protein (cupin superfamily)